MGRSGPGPFGALLMSVGVLLTVGVAWGALNDGDWLASLPSLLIGLALVAFGYSLIIRARAGR